MEYAEITEVVHGIDINIKNKNGKVFYKTIKHIVELDGTEKFSFGKAFSLSSKQKNFSITLSGTLTERIKQLEFLDDVIRFAEKYKDEKQSYSESFDEIRNEALKEVGSQAEEELAA